MIIKKREKPMNLLRYEALRARLSKASPSYHFHMNEAYKYERGYAGELEVDKQLKFFAADFTILQDVTLRLHGQPFQMDTILISPEKLFLLEIKNYKGTLVFDTVLNQFIRENNEKETGFHHPLTQLDLQKTKMETWLKQHRLPPIPVHPLLVFSDIESIIRVNGNADEIVQNVTHGERLPIKMMEILQEDSSNQKFQHHLIGKEIMKKAGTVDMNPFATTTWQPGEVLPGVRCTKCSSLQMKRVGHQWKCPICNYGDKAATKYSIDDYFMLFKPWISNRECNEFLQLNSRHRTLLELRKSPDVTYDRKKRVWRKK